MQERTEDYAELSQPSTLAGEIAKICGRRLLGEPGMVQRIVTQPPVDTITLEVDSDPAGRLRTQRSTTGIAGLSREACDQASINDTDSDRVFKRRVRILRPNAVAQPQRWAGKNMATDYGHEVEVALGNSFGIRTGYVALTGSRESARR